MSVQRVIERDEIPYPYKVHDTTLRPLLNITIKSTIVVRSSSRSCSGGDICGTTPAFRSDVNIAIGSARSGYPVEGAAALGFRQAFYAVHRA